MRSQLRRVDGEVSAMAQRVRRLDEGLEESEKSIRSATAALGEAAAYEEEHGRHEGESQDALTQFDAQLKLLEGKLMQARALAEQAKGESSTPGAEKE